MTRRNPTASQSKAITLAVFIVLPLALSASACELIASVDRSQIGGQTEFGGSSGTGGDSAAAGGESPAVGGQSPGTGGDSPASGGSAEAGDSGVGGDSGASGETSTGGATVNMGGFAGASGHSGSSGSAGSSGLGGSSGHGGSSDVGGSSNLGGSSGVGGSSNLGGSSGVGGSSNLGGSSNFGGSSNLGGSLDVGGSSNLGGGGSGGISGKIIYLTSTPKKANFGGVSGADAECNASPPIAGTYKALLVDGTTRVACTSAQCVTSGAAEGVGWVLAPNTKYVRADGTTVIATTTGAAIFSFPLAASIGTNAFSYWTGLSADWTTSPDSCSGWAQTTGFFATEGLADTTDSQAIVGVSESCATLAGAVFACVQQ